MPYKPDEREYRSFDMQFEAVDGGADECLVEGYATTFDDPYDFGPEGCRECISSRALDGADMSDVIFQLDHNGTPLARLRNGTLELVQDAHGLLVRAKLFGSRAGRDAYEAIRNRLIDRMSWGFTIADGGWSYDPETRTSTINKVKKVFDVSAVTFPANAATEIHARSYLDGVIEAEKQELLLREKELDARRRAALKLRLL